MVDMVEISKSNQKIVEVGHLFEGFYTQVDNLEVFEDAFLTKCRNAGGVEARFAAETYEAMKGSNVSLGIKMQEDGTMVVEKFFTRGENEDDSSPEQKPLVDEEARAPSPAGDEKKKKRQTFVNVSDQSLRRDTLTGEQKLKMGPLVFNNNHGDLGGHQQKLKPSQSHGWPGTYSVFKLGEYKDKHDNLGKTLSCCLSKDTNTRINNEGYDWVLTILSGESVGEDGPTVIQLSEVTFDNEHDIVWNVKLKQIASHHEPKLNRGVLGCCAIS